MWAELHYKGTLSRVVNLAAHTWFRTGGSAEFFFEPHDESDIELFLRHYPPTAPLYILGAGSNTLVRDGGVKGVVMCLPFKQIEAHGDKITAGTAALAQQVAHAALDKQLTGLEFMRGIPGTIGGCVAMNAGAHGSDTASVFVQAQAYDRAGNKKLFTKTEMAFGYRTAVAEHIFIAGVFQGKPTDAAVIKQRMAEAQAARRAAQPAGARTSGSTFKNPAPEVSHKKAWQLIDEAGARAFNVGGAKIDDKHCNFLVNQNNATASDIEALGEKMRSAVKAHSSVTLEWEIKRIGEKNE